MNSTIIVLLVMVVIMIIQVLLSIQLNKYFGLIIPCINLLCSIVISLLFSDIITAIFGFFVSFAPMVIWLGIYKICRRRMKRKNQNEINRMKINDM